MIDMLLVAICVGVATLIYVGTEFFRRVVHDEDYTRREYPPAPARCGYCGKSFGSQEDKQAHVLDEHGWIYDQSRRGAGIS